MNEKTKDIIEWVVCIIVAIVLALVIRFYVITPTVVNQESMKPTLENGDKLLLNRWMKTTNSKINRGDIITFQAPSKKKFENNEADISNPVAEYNNNINGTLEKFSYYVLELTKESYIKRVIGLPGEYVYIDENGNVYVDGNLLDESYLPNGVKTKTGTFNELVVPDGYLFVMGDNREYSMDSRAFGCIPIEKVEGRVLCRIWPFSKFGTVD